MNESCRRLDRRPVSPSHRGKLLCLELLVRRKLSLLLCSYPSLLNAPLRAWVSLGLPTERRVSAAWPRVRIP